MSRNPITSKITARLRGRLQKLPYIHIRQICPLKSTIEYNNRFVPDATYIHLEEPSFKHRTLIKYISGFSTYI